MTCDMTANNAVPRWKSELYHVRTRLFMNQIKLKLCHETTSPWTGDHCNKFIFEELGIIFTLIEKLQVYFLG